VLDLDDYPEGSDDVLVAMKDIIEPRRKQENVPGRRRAQYVSRRQVADWLEKDKEWVRYRLDELVDGGALEKRAWDAENARGPPIKVYQPNWEAWKWMDAEVEIDRILGERPTKVREYHVRKILSEVGQLREEVEELREEVE